MSEFKYCPECGEDDYAYIDSCREMQISEISCGLCDFRFQKKVPEETLIEKYNKIKRKPQLELLRSSWRTEKDIAEDYPHLLETASEQV